MRRVIGFVMLGIAGVIGLNVFVHVMGIGSSAPDTSVNRNSTQPDSPPDPQRLQTCQKLLKSAPRGAIRSYERRGEYGSVVVGPSYTFAEFDAKEALDSVMRCVLSEGRKDNVGVDYVEYLDPYSHKEVAKWSKYTGFSVN